MRDMAGGQKDIINIEMNIFNLNRLLMNFYSQQAPRLEEILKKEMTAEELLDTEQIVMAVKNSTNVFIRHLVREREVLPRLLHYMLFQQGDLSRQFVQKELSDDKPKEYKYPMVASELLSLDSYNFTQLFFIDFPLGEEDEDEELEEHPHDDVLEEDLDQAEQDKHKEEQVEQLTKKMEEVSVKDSPYGLALLTHLLSFLEQPFNDIQANYFQVIVSNILEHNTVAFTRHLASLPDTMKALVTRCDSHSVAQVLQKVLQSPSKQGEDVQNVQVVKERTALLSLVLDHFLSLGKEEPSEQEEHCLVNLTALLVELVSQPCNGQHILLDTFRQEDLLNKVMLRQHPSPFSRYGLQVVLALLKLQSSVEQEDFLEHPDVQALLPHLSLLVTLSGTPGQPLNTNQTQQTVLSQRDRLLALQVVQCLLQQPDQSEVHSSLLSSPLYDHLLDALQVPLNNMLHILVSDMLTLLLSKDSHRQALLRHGLLSKVARASGSRGAGSRGVAIKVAMLIQQKGYGEGEENVEWTALVEGSLREAEEHYNLQLGGYHPKQAKDNRGQETQQKDSNQQMNKLKTLFGKMSNQVASKEGEEEEEEQEEQEDHTEYSANNFWKVENNEYDLHSLMQDL